jgi:hypothetical protein
LTPSTAVCNALHFPSAFARPAHMAEPSLQALLPDLVGMIRFDLQVGRQFDASHAALGMVISISTDVLL